MARGLNKVMLIGNLGNDVELKYTQSGVAVCSFRMATTESYKDQSGNTIDKTEWHNIVMWRRLAEVAGEYLKKGSKVYVEGKLQTRSWEDQNGNKRYMTEIVADRMLMLDRREGSTEEVPVPEEAAETSKDDDLPF